MGDDNVEQKIVHMNNEESADVNHTSPQAQENNEEKSNDVEAKISSKSNDEERKKEEEETEEKNLASSRAAQEVIILDPAENAIVLYDFAPQKPKHLAVKRGTTITISEIRKNWWTAKYQNNTGLVPANYVTLVKNGRDGVALFDYIRGDSSMLKFQKGDKLKIWKEGDDGWSIGSRDIFIGAFPSNFVQVGENPQGTGLISKLKKVDSRESATTDQKQNPPLFSSVSLKKVVSKENNNNNKNENEQHLPYSVSLKKVIPSKKFLDDLLNNSNSNSTSNFSNVKTAESVSPQLPKTVNRKEAAPNEAPAMPVPNETAPRPPNGALSTRDKLMVSSPNLREVSELPVKPFEKYSSSPVLKETTTIQHSETERSLEKRVDSPKDRKEKEEKKDKEDKKEKLSLSMSSAKRDNSERKRTSKREETRKKFGSVSKSSGESIKPRRAGRKFTVELPDVPEESSDDQASPSTTLKLKTRVNLLKTDSFTKANVSPRNTQLLLPSADVPRKTTSVHSFPTVH